MPTVTMSMDEYMALLATLQEATPASLERMTESMTPAPTRNRVKSTKYSRVYKREFRKVAPRYKTKSGKWKKDGFKSAVRAAHRATKKIVG